jgi:hypothetical protein
VRVAHVESSEQRAVLRVVRNLSIVNFALVIGMVAYAHAIAMTVPQIIPPVLTALLSAVPVALPATFTLAATLGANTQALKGVLLTRLSALHEAAMIDVLCADKTGTLTENELAVAAVSALREGDHEEDVLTAALLASSTEGQDPIDAAIRSTAQRKRGSHERLQVVRFTPFDPAAKMAEAVAINRDGIAIRVVKGAPAAIATIAPLTPLSNAELEAFTAAGYRTLAIASGPPGSLELIGLLAFSDPPRADSRPLLAELRSLGVRPVMVTGDAAATATTVAEKSALRAPSARQGRSPRASGRKTSPSMPASFLKTNFVWSEPFNTAATPSACAVMAPMTRRRFGRRRWASQCRPRPMSLKQRQGWCSPTRPRRDHRLHQGRAIGLSANSGLYVEYSRQQIRGHRRARRGPGHHRSRRPNSTAAGSLDADGRHRDDVAGGGPGRTFTAPRRLAHPQSHPCCDPAGLVQAQLLHRRACDKLV